jgi:hypothetical protein
MICFHCTTKYAQGTKCPACDSPAVFNGPVEVLKSIAYPGGPEVAEMVAPVIQDKFTVIVEKDSGYVVLQAGTQHVTIWNPTAIVTEVEWPC